MLRCCLRPRSPGAIRIEDQAKPEAVRHQLAQRDLDRTLDLLSQARATGEFKGMIRLDEVRRNPTLDMLRHGLPGSSS